MYYWIAFPIYEVHTREKLHAKQKSSKKCEVPTELVATVDLRGERFLNKNDGVEEEEDEDVDTDMDQDTKTELNKRLLSEINKTKKKSQLFNKKELNFSQAAKNVANNLYLEEKKTDSTTKYATPPFYRKVLMLWSSPFTKFWANFISYICFLILFGVVTLWPCCGKLIFRIY